MGFLLWPTGSDEQNGRWLTPTGASKTGKLYPDQPPEAALFLKALFGLGE